MVLDCVGFIMDGNRRWAKARGLSVYDGHAKGYQVMKEMIMVVHTMHIPHMIVYAFSSENWKRAEEEVGYLMNLMHLALEELHIELQQSSEKKINLRVIGQIERLPQNIQSEILQIERQNHSEPELTVWVALSYGGRAEIVQGINRAILEGMSVTEESFEKFLWTYGLPDPDLIIRTSGEKRLSNFLLWQSAYSEFFFTPTLWPDFGESEFRSMLSEFTERQRRRGE